jgi:hypothetical protein
MKNIKLLSVPIILLFLASCVPIVHIEYSNRYAFDIQNNSSHGVAIRFYNTVGDYGNYEALVEDVPAERSATVKLLLQGDGGLPKHHPYGGAISFYDVSADLRPFHETLLITIFEDGGSILDWDSARSDEVGQPVYRLTVTDELLNSGGGQ